MLDSKFLLTTGWNGDAVSKSEILDLTKEGGNQCPNWIDYPLDVYGATGSLFENIPLICGGYDSNHHQSSNACYTIIGQTATVYANMTERRVYAASTIVLDYYGFLLWIGGGYDTSPDNVHASSEYVTNEGTFSGPSFPISLYGHAMESITYSLTWIVGGVNNGIVIPLTFRFDHVEQQWMNGPDLIQGRYAHAACIIVDELTDERLLLVSGGIKALGNETIVLDSTEILLDNKWVSGKFFIVSKVTISSIGFTLSRT